MSTSRFWIPKLASQQNMVFDLFLGKPVDLGIEAIDPKLCHLGRGRRAPVAEGALERTAAIFVSHNPIQDSSDWQRSVVEAAEQEGRRHLVEIAEAGRVWQRVNRPASSMKAYPWNITPNRRREIVREWKECQLAFIVHGNVNARVLRAGKVLADRHMRSPKTITILGLTRFQPACNLKRDAAYHTYVLKPTISAVTSCSTASLMRMRL